MQAEILRLLKENVEYLSGQQLCERLKVSRTAVWKAVEQLREQGYQIDAVKNKGYKLVHSPGVFCKSEIASGLTTKWAGRRLYFYEQTDSTNNDCRRLLQEGGEHGLLVIAQEQSGGKGRRGRGWVSPAGVNVFMTIGLRPDFLPEKASMLTLVMAMAVCDGVRALSGADARIKWPNDVVMNKKKICGILTEMNTQMEYIEYVLIGVGINVNQEAFPAEIADTATSLLLETKKSYDRALIVQKVMEYFEHYYERFAESGDMSDLMQTYNENLVNVNASVRVLDPKGEFDGISRGINEKGELIVETEDGRTEYIYAGEVSVRGIYGYV